MENNKVYSTILSERAQKEILSSWEWYEDRQEGLGDRFVTELLHKISVMERNPELYSSKYLSYREAILPTFPVVIIYRINKRKKVIRGVSGVSYRTKS